MGIKRQLRRVWELGPQEALGQGNFARKVECVLVSTLTLDVQGQRGCL